METHVFGQKIPLVVVIHEQSHIPTLKIQRPKAPLVLKLPANSIPSRDTDFRIAVVTAVNVHPKYVLLRGLVVNDLRALDDAVRSKIARAGAREQSTFVFPFHEVLTGVAVDVLESRAVRLVFADP